MTCTEDKSALRINRGDRWEGAQLIPSLGRQEEESIPRTPPFSPPGAEPAASLPTGCHQLGGTSPGDNTGLRFHHLQTLNFFNDQRGWEVAAPGTNGERMGMGRLPGSGERLPGVRTGNGHLTALTPKAMPWVLLGHPPSHPTHGLPHIPRGARGRPGAPGLRVPQRCRPRAPPVLTGQKQIPPVPAPAWSTTPQEQGRLCWASQA